MEITLIKRKNKDSYIIIETEEKRSIYKAKTITKNTGTCYGMTENIVYESEVFDAIFLREVDKIT